MDWESIFGIITAIIFAVLLPLTLRKRKKAGLLKLEELLGHLEQLGVRASAWDKGTAEEKVGISRASGQRSEGVIRLEGRNFPFINVVSQTSQYGVNYFLDYLVKSPSGTGQVRQRKTRMVSKKSSLFDGRVIDIEWRGDRYLSQGLNMDYRLKDYLLQAEPKEIKGGIQVIPEPRHEYDRIRTGYMLPSLYFFEAVDIIAGHVRSAW